TPKQESEPHRHFTPSALHPRRFCSSYRFGSGPSVLPLSASTPHARPDKSLRPFQQWFISPDSMLTLIQENRSAYDSRRKLVCSATVEACLIGSIAGCVCSVTTDNFSEVTRKGAQSRMWAARSARRSPQAAATP